MPNEGVGMGVPSIKAQQESAETADAEMDTALENILGDDYSEDTPAPGQEAPDEPKDGQVRDKTGRFTKKSDGAEDGEPTAATSDGANTDEYRNALRSLQKDRVPTQVLESLKPDEIIAWGNERAQNHLDVDRIQSRIAELEQPPAEEAKPPPDLDETLDKFKEFFGEEAAEPLKAYGEALLAKFQAGQQGQQDQLAQIVARMQAQEQNEARQALSERWALSDVRWQVVTDQMDRDKNEYPTRQDAVQAACRQLFADDDIDELNSKLHIEHDKRDRGQPTTEHRRAPAESKTIVDLEDQALDNILDGDDAALKKTSRAMAQRSQKQRVAPVVGRVGMK